MCLSVANAESLWTTVDAMHLRGMSTFIKCMLIRVLFSFLMLHMFGKGACWIKRMNYQGTTMFTCSYGLYGRVQIKVHLQPKLTKHIQRSKAEGGSNPSPS